MLKMELKHFVTFSILFILELIQQMYAVSVPKFTDFYFSVEPTNVIAIRDQSAMFDCAVFVGEITPNVELAPTIEWIKDGQKLNLQDDNRRLIVQKNGSLLISPVHSGGLDVGQYQCTATVPGLGTLVSRKAYLHLAHLSKIFRTEPQDLSVYLYDAAMLGCVIDGVPNPNISWFKDGQPLQEKRTIRIHSDGVLEIYPVQFSDFGTYYCVAENIDKRLISRTAKLEQNADVEVILNGLPPSFVYKPEDTLAEAGSTVTLFCGANGRDTQQKEPTITWLKDGNAIDFKQAQGRLEIVGRGSLKIYSANEDDSGTYTCRAENLLDSVDSDASLTVLVPPKFIRQPLNQIAHENSDIEFKCEMEGSPQPEVVWMKDGIIQKPSDYFKIIEKKHLRILGLLPSDAGMYQCFGNNSIGNIQASVQLMVVSQNVPLPTTPSLYRIPNYLGGNYGNEINLPSEPQDLLAVIVSKQFVTLKWDAPDRTGPLNERDLVYSVYWKERDSERERVLNTTLKEANIQHLKPDTNYEFRIRAYNSYGPSPKFARISITTERDIDVPTPPENVVAVPLSSDSIRVSWDPPAETKGSIAKFKLMYYMTGDKQENIIEVIKRYHVLQGLNTFKTYSISVVAFNENGEGARSDEIEARTLSDKPSDIPQNVTLEAASSNSVILRWEPPPEEKRNGVITGYKIRYKKRDDDARSRTVTTDGNRRLYALTDLEKNTQYQVKIAAINVNGTGPYTSKFKATTFRDDLDESVVPPPPRKLRVTSYATSIRVSWTPPEPESKIMVRGYTLGYGKGIADVYMEVLAPDVNVFTIEDLEPNAEYVITVRAFNKKGDGQPKYQTAKTSEREVLEPVTPMMPPVGLKTIVLSSSTVLLTWSDTSLGSSQRNTDNRYYTVRYTAMQGSNRRHQYVNSTGLNCHIDNLKPYSKYEFSVKVIKGRRQSTWSMSVLNTTEEAAPGTHPRDLTTIRNERNPQAVRLNWQPPVLPNGQITGYLIYYTTDPNLDDVEWVVEGVLGERLTTSIKGLTPDTTYYFKVQARNNKGYSPTSPTVIYKTPKSDGTGGGKINPLFPQISPDKGSVQPVDFDFNQISPVIPEEEKEDEKEDDGSKVGGLSTNIIIIIIASVVGCVFCVVIIVVAIVFCKRRDYGERGKRPPQGPQSPNKKPGQKDLKPPDLWIHHDPMEMKSLNKPDRSESMLTMSTMRRNSQDSRSIDDNLPPYRPDMDRQNSDVYYCGEDSFPRRQGGLGRPKPSKLSISVDTQGPPREPVAMVTALPNGMAQDNQSQGHPRPGFPRTQYNMQYSSTPRVNAGDMPQPSSMPILTTDYHYKLSTLDEDDFSSINNTMEDCYPARVGYARSTEALSITGRSQPTAIVTPDKRTNDGHKSLPRHSDGHKSLPRNMHPMRSFSVPTPPPLGQKYGGPAPKHQIVKPQQSPYKKTAPISSVPIKPRTMTVISTPKAPDIILKSGKESEGELQKSASTEELTAEMENLDCLMKDLNAITQQDFQC